MPSAISQEAGRPHRQSGPAGPAPTGVPLDRPTVTIVTATMNNPSALAAALASVRAQAHRPLEHIIVDGGSDEETGRLVREHERTGNLTVVYVRERDTGMYEAVNKGIRRATGVVVGILNSDDCYLPDTVAKVVAGFAATDAEMVFGNILCEGPDRTWEWTARPEELDRHMSIPHPGVFIRTAVYRQRGGFDERLKLAADYELLLRLRTAGVRMAHLPAVLCRFRTGGMSHTRLWRAATETFVVQRRHVGFMPAVTVFLRRWVEYFVLRPILPGLRALGLKRRADG